MKCLEATSKTGNSENGCSLPIKDSLPYTSTANTFPSVPANQTTCQKTALLCCLHF